MSRDVCVARRPVRSALPRGAVAAGRLVLERGSESGERLAAASSDAGRLRAAFGLSHSDGRDSQQSTVTGARSHDPACSVPTPVLSDTPPQHAIKTQLLTAIDARSCPPRPCLRPRRRLGAHRRLPSAPIDLLGRGYWPASSPFAIRWRSPRGGGPTPGRGHPTGPSGRAEPEAGAAQRPAPRQARGHIAQRGRFTHTHTA